MSNSIKITIPFTPKAKGSWRMGKFGQYNPSQKGMKQTRQYVENLIGAENCPLMTGPLLVIVHFRIPAPSGLKGTPRRKHHNRPHYKKPDGDNLEKFLNDAMNGVLWDDDSRIAWLFRSKSTTTEREGCTHVYVRELQDVAANYEDILPDLIDNIQIDKEEVKFDSITITEKAR